MDLLINSKLHPAVIQVGLWFNRGTVTSSNARCEVMLQAFKEVCVVLTLKIDPMRRPVHARPRVR